MKSRERILALVLVLVAALAALVVYRQSADSGVASVDTRRQVSSELARELAAIRNAEAIKDPVARCLAYPDPSELKWDTKIVHRRCGQLSMHMMSADEMREALAKHQPETLEQAFDSYSMKNSSDPEQHGLLTWTFFWMFQGSGQKIDAMTEEWVQQAPKSAYALAARGIHFAASAYHARGNALARDVPPENFEHMHEFMEKARADLEASAALNPQLIAAYHGLLYMARLTSDQELIDSAAKRALAIDPADPWIYEDWLNDLDPRWGGSVEAVSQIAEMAASHADREPLLVLEKAAPYCATAQAYSCSECGHKDYRKALEIYREAAQFGPATCVLENADWASNSVQDYEGAVRYASQAIRFFGPTSYHLNQRANALQHLGQYEAALKDLDAAWDLNTQDVNALYVRGTVLEDLQRYADAENSFLSILAIDPKDSSATVALSMLYLTNLPKPDKAEHLISGMLERNPKHARAWLLKAALAKGKDESLCKDALEKYLLYVDRNDPYEKRDIDMATRRLAELKGNQQVSAGN
jgi:tetratricopeptide (TPR) repeat protein